MWEKMTVQITGIAPLRMHNPRLANTLDPIAKAIKAISSSRHKVDADIEEMAHLEFLGSLYLVKDDSDPCIPANVMYGVMAGKGGAARSQKMGKQAKLGIIISKDFPLVYDGPKKAEKLWKDKKYVHQQFENVQGSRIMRTTPIFPEWSAVIEIEYNPDFVNIDTVKAWVEIAGSECGLMERRPVFGRFESKIIN